MAGLNGREEEVSTLLEILLYALAYIPRQVAYLDVSTLLEILPMRLGTA